MCFVVVALVNVFKDAGVVFCQLNKISPRRVSIMVGIAHRFDSVDGFDIEEGGVVSEKLRNTLAEFSFSFFLSIHTQY